ncbi:hypothetical protein K491DRAFT_713843 [Lophiostoma macrostomum CBS 122681]|uniref:WSC domain-containing protein n=1 Tax=Lophiostoma macrostomum CBS 122681 TaxID=1314788 RepID=A0A6A6TE01_9PLEO|nr:hypothetical protein K491DRAFT_713843 [Lophiostoma macrostomum CBS 122681]
MASAESSSSSIVSIPTPTVSVVASAFTEIGCFSTAVPLEDHGSYQFQSLGNCQLICTMLDKPVLGLVDGTNCWCGDLIPPEDAQVSNSSCDTPCSGIKTDHCGGDSLWWITLTGTTLNHVKNYDPASSSSSSSVTSTTSSTPIPEKTSAAQTVLVTASNSAAPKKSSGPNTTGIAVGVVVGVLVLAAIIGGVVLFLRRKRRQQIEEDYRRNAAINSFTAGGKPHTSNSSMTDSRLDPEFMNRRASNGSIADNEDYSRRILKVTNV